MVQPASFGMQLAEPAPFCDDDPTDEAAAEEAGSSSGDGSSSPEGGSSSELGVLARECLASFDALDWGEQAAD